VLMTLMVWFCFRGTATPERAGMVWFVPGVYFEAGRADIVVVWDLSRLTRDQKAKDVLLCQIFRLCSPLGV
jgi:hypothetical protein